MLLLTFFQDGKLSKEEMVQKYKLFVRSSSTRYSDEFNTHHDEL